MGPESPNSNWWARLRVADFPGHVDTSSDAVKPETTYAGCSALVVREHAVVDEDLADAAREGPPRGGDGPDEAVVLRCEKRARG